jgi:drug/metabolite transporter (DMT)-like permease
MLGRTMASGSGLQLPMKVTVAAVAFGICAAVAFLAFQTSISFGKVTVGWLMMNLSAGVPAIVSIWVYGERLTWLKYAAYAIALLAVLGLFQGSNLEWREAEQSGTKAKGSERLLWFFLMLVILLTNGMSSFGLKMLSAWALPASVKFPYLTVWYAAGFACIAVPMLAKRMSVRLGELGWGAALAVLSIGGQVTMALALDAKAPGNIVFPVTIGGSVLVVVVAGRLFFGERMNRLTTAGFALGFLAVILLSVS